MVRGFALSQTGATEEQMVTGDMAKRRRMVVTKAVMKQSAGREMERSVSTCSSPRARRYGWRGLRRLGGVAMVDEGGSRLRGRRSRRQRFEAPTVDSFYGDIAGSEAELLGCSPEIGVARNGDARRRLELGLGRACMEE
jgi:hypothetical protein